MQVATLIVNPAAGRAGLPASQLAAIQTLLAGHGYTSKVVETTAAAGSAKTLATQAARESALVLACGGDGTVHGVVQGLAHSGVALGVVPLGTQNALAHNLHLPLDPLAAVTQLMNFVPVSLPLGELTTGAETRLFLTMAGCGPSGALAQRLATPLRSKQLLGRAAYPWHAAGLLAGRRWPAFRVEYRLPGAEWLATEAVALLVSRVPDLGGVFSRLTPAAALTAPALHVHLLRGPAHLALPAWFAGVRNPWHSVIDAEELRCIPAEPAKPVLLQVDAEPMGALPCRMRMIPGALRLLMPRAARVN